MAHISPERLWLNETRVLLVERLEDGRAEVVIAGNFKVLSAEVVAKLVAREETPNPAPFPRERRNHLNSLIDAADRLQQASQKEANSVERRENKAHSAAAEPVNPIAPVAPTAQPVSGAARLPQPKARPKAQPQAEAQAPVSAPKPAASRSAAPPRPRAPRRPRKPRAPRAGWPSLDQKIALSLQAFWEANGS